jgi:hypothetical protein
VVVKKATTIVKDEEKMDVDDTGDLKSLMEALLAATDIDDTQTGYQYPVSFKLAVQIMFSMLSHVLKNCTRKVSPFARATLNPYLTVILTFISTISKHPATLAILERSIPWSQPASLLLSPVMLCLPRVSTSQVSERGG